ncbi:MAG: DUF3035 domain-containing protein [Rickettsiales bacterium]|jgi:hypothetical protein|nr:DUF3035 domain-containing protein [Rickettsiales bacterium]
MSDKTIKFSLMTCLLLLAGCGTTTVKETLGIDQRAPDEFRVVSRPPLSVPPQFNLRPPSVPDGTGTIGADDKARAAVVGAGEGENRFKLGGNPAEAAKPAAQTGGKTTAESRLLEQAGATAADPAVRRELAEEKLVIQEQKEDRPWWDLGLSPEKKEPVVDAKGEAERLEKNEREGKPPTEGETASTKPKDRGILDWLW